MFSCAGWRSRRKNPHEEPNSPPILAHGGGSTVFGPLTVTALDIAFHEWTGKMVPVSLDPVEIYVLKLHRNKKEACPFHPQVLEGQASWKYAKIIVPVWIEETTWGTSVEVQVYGGVEFSTLLLDPEWEWTDDMIWDVWTSMVDILILGHYFILHHGLFLCDLKAENMVYCAERGGLSLIDVEWVTQECVFQKRTEDIVFTLDPLNLPVEFMAVFSPKRQEVFGATYESMWDRAATHCNQKTRRHTMGLIPDEWTPHVVKKLAPWCLVYCFLGIWTRVAFSWKQVLPPLLYTRMRRIMHWVAEERLETNVPGLVLVMEKVRWKHFDTLWECDEPQEFSGEGDEEIDFPLVKINPATLFQNYFSP